MGTMMTIAELRKESWAKPVGKRLFRRIHATVKSVHPYDEAYWYEGCRFFSNEKNRYCQKATKLRYCMQDEDEGVEHSGPCLWSKKFWRLGVVLSDHTGQLSAEIWGAAAYLFGQNGIPIFANHVAALNENHGEDHGFDIYKAIVGDNRIFDIECETFPEPNKKDWPAFTVKHVH